MANSRSARKRIRANERKHVRNRAIRSSVRTKVGKARRALVGLDDTIDSQAQLLVAVSALDRAADKGVLHPNNAARRKSRLMALAQRLEAAAEESDDALADARARALGGEKGRKTATRPRAAAATAAAEVEPDEAAGEAAEVAPAPARRGARTSGGGTTGKAKATTSKATTAKSSTPSSSRSRSKS